MKKINSIFIVEDDSIATFIIKKIITDYNNPPQISTFTNGKPALEVINNISIERLPDVILLDINMPIMDGWEFLEAIDKAKLKTISIYMLTSSIDTTDIEKFKKTPQIRGYFTKPFSIEMYASILNGK